MLDIKLPIGLMFAVFGIILTIFGVITNGNEELYKISLSINVNLISGALMLVFGVLMLVFARKTKAEGEAEKK